MAALGKLTKSASSAAAAKPNHGAHTSLRIVVWLSAVVFLITSFVMFKYGGGYYGIISNAARHLIEAKQTNTNLPAAQKE